MYLFENCFGKNAEFAIKQIYPALCLLVKLFFPDQEAKTSFLSMIDGA